MNYLQIYNDLCESRKLMDDKRVVLKKSGEYFENHHIKPRCTGGDNSKKNLVLLTAREHFIAHALLFYDAKENHHGKVKRDLIYAFVVMKGQTKKLHRGERYFNARLYESVRIEIIKMQIGTTHSEETKRKISAAKQNISDETRQKISKAMIGKVCSEQTKMKMSKAMKGIKRGPMTKGRVSIKRTAVTKQKMSESAKNEKRVECPHCYNQFRASHAKRWHFDNCKQKSS